MLLHYRTCASQLPQFILSFSSFRFAFLRPFSCRLVSCVRRARATDAAIRFTSAKTNDGRHKSSINASRSGQQPENRSPRYSPTQNSYFRIYVFILGEHTSPVRFVRLSFLCSALNRCRRRAGRRFSWPDPAAAKCNRFSA